jgi:hypothetical protein
MLDYRGRVLDPSLMLPVIQTLGLPKRGHDNQARSDIGRSLRNLSTRSRRKGYRVLKYVTLDNIMLKVSRLPRQFYFRFHLR